VPDIDIETLRRLRGRLGEEDPNRPNRGPGARGLEHMARNRRCQRLAAVTLAGASADAAARRLGIAPVSEDASPFAAARGHRFEENLFKDDCERIWRAYARAGLLPADFPHRDDLHEQWIDTEKGTDGRGEFSLPERLRQTEKLLLARARGDLSTPTLILKPRLTVHAGSQQFTIEPDGLIAAPGEPFYRVMEIKSYPDRQGYTSQSKTGSAARQAAVGVVALRQLLASNDLDERLAEATADLIFSNAGSDSPTLTRLPISGETDNIAATLTDAGATVTAVLDAVGAGTLDDPDVLEQLDTFLCSSCSSHCAMFEHCRASAIHQGHPVMLGDQASELLQGFTSMGELIALRDRQATTDDPDRQAVADLLASAHAAFAAAQDDRGYDATVAAGEDEDTGTDEAIPLYAADDADDDREQLEIIA